MSPHALPGHICNSTEEKGLLPVTWYPKSENKHRGSKKKLGKAHGKGDFQGIRYPLLNSPIGVQLKDRIPDRLHSKS